MSARNRRLRKRTKAEIDLELAKLDVLCRKYEAEQLYKHTVTEDVIRNWKNQRGYIS